MSSDIDQFLWSICVELSTCRSPTRADTAAVFKRKLKVIYFVLFLLSNFVRFYCDYCNTTTTTTTIFFNNKLTNATMCTTVAIHRIELFTGGAVIYIQSTVKTMVDMFKMQPIHYCTFLYCKLAYTKRLSCNIM